MGLSQVEQPWRDEGRLRSLVSHPGPSFVAGQEQLDTGGSRDIVLPPVCAQTPRHKG